MVLDKHAPIKSKKIHTRFTSEGLSKAIMCRSKLRNRYTKWPSREDSVAFKKWENYCNNLSRKIKNYFTKIASKGVTGNKNFWNAVKPFLTSKGFIYNNDITINFNNWTITDDKELSKIFNKYINIVQNSTGTAPAKISSKYKPNNDKLVVEEIVKTWKPRKYQINWR